MPSSTGWAGGSRRQPLSGTPYDLYGVVCNLVNDLPPAVATPSRPRKAESHTVSLAATRGRLLPSWRSAELWFRGFHGETLMQREISW
jgi:hypothetical protein